MLENKRRTEEEKQQYLADLRAWLLQEREKPAEGMGAFFAARLENYEDVHLSNWGEEYREIAGFFDEGLENLLDLGCGTGLELEAMYRRFPHLQVTGIDLSPDMLGKLKEKYGDKGIRLIEADYFQYPLGENVFDAALTFETLHHFEFARKQAIYDKICQALRPGGYYIECDYIACGPEEEAMCLEQYHYKRRKAGVPEGQFIHVDIPLTLEHQLTLMENAGFRNIRVLVEREGTMIIRAEK